MLVSGFEWFWSGILLSFFLVIEWTRDSQTVPHRKSSVLSVEEKKPLVIDAKWFMVNADGYKISALSISAFPTKECPSKMSYKKEINGLWSEPPSSGSWSHHLGSAKLESLWQKERFQGLCGLWFLASAGLVVPLGMNTFQELGELLSVLNFPPRNLSKHIVF